ncbi:hypothetical protein EYF80_025251 [Liparis tanakae]|uniref:Uncharacterized protein n=1 Tax=Liparis tanakae TaxID=230148 RepID=A0A4Z2HHT1_9TELE|nr:hypothetical protein EYF80_025251 [Liparis tanakae]
MDAVAKQRSAQPLLSKNIERSLKGKVQTGRLTPAALHRLLLLLRRVKEGNHSSFLLLPVDSNTLKASAV